MSKQGWNTDVFQLCFCPVFSALLIDKFLYYRYRYYRLVCIFITQKRRI